MRQDSLDRETEPTGGHPEISKDSFFSGEALDIAQSLSFPRLTGSDGECKAISVIEEYLGRSGLTAEKELFPAFISVDRILATGCITLLAVIGISRIVSFWSPQFASAIVFAATATFLFYPSIWLRILKRMFPDPENRGSDGISSTVCRNLVVRLFPSEEARRNLHLVAHYDSKSQSISILQRIFLYVVSLASMGVLGSGYLFASARISGRFPSAIAEIPFAVVVASLAVLLFARSGNNSSGGLDNAGSVAILLRLALRLRKRGLRSTQVTCLFTAAEEQGLQGAMAYSLLHRGELDPERTFFLNLDCTGIAGRAKIFSQGKSFLSSPVSGFVIELQNLGKRFGIKRFPVSFGFLLDHQAFASMGFQSASLACVSRKIVNVHTSRDTASLLEVEGLKEIEDFILELIENWESDRFQASSKWYR